MTIEIPLANTLKEKRSALTRLLEMIRKKGHASACEAGFQNRIRSSVIAVAIIGNTRGQCERSANILENVIEQFSQIQLLEAQREWL